MSLQGEMSIRLGLPSAPLVEGPKLFIEFLQVYNAIKVLGYSLDSYTGAITAPYEDWAEIGLNSASVGNIAKIYIVFYETAEIGNTIAFDDISSIPMARLADTTYRARGVCTKATEAGDMGEVTLFGRFPLFPAGSLTPGLTYHQSATAGEIIPGPSANQAIGYAITDTSLFFNPSL